MTRSKAGYSGPESGQKRFVMWKRKIISKATHPWSRWKGEVGTSSAVQVWEGRRKGKSMPPGRVVMRPEQPVRRPPWTGTRRRGEAGSRGS